MRLIPRLRQRLGAEHGFTMATVMAGMLLVMIISVAAVTAAGGDIGLARYDQDDKNAYAAAEAGINDYLGNLNSDSNYWSKCTNVTSPVSQRGWKSDLTEPAAVRRRWKDVPGSTTAEYSIELVPAPGETTCKEDDPLQSMVKDGNVRIRATGRVKNTNNYRTINATFRRTGFLDFLYYTKYENQDPRYYSRSSAKEAWESGNLRAQSGNLPLPNWVEQNCDRLWWGDVSKTGLGRENARWYGEYKFVYNNTTYWIPVTYSTQSVGCGEIQFAPEDQVDGPFHSEDSILICGDASFGSSSNTDRVEIVAPSFRKSGGSDCSADPVFRPRLTTNAASLDPPVTNKQLDALTLPGYSFTGQTEITLNGTQMTVKNNNTTQTKALPANGVVYVSNSTCTGGYDPENPDNKPAGCGDVRLKGSTYSKDLTIAAQNDIIVENNTVRASGSKALLGLISDSFVRVAHPSCDSANPNNIKIDAAILALDGSFTVDKYWCGSKLGDLTVNGAIAQYHRGVVGSGGSGGTGYIKKYSYNPELKYRSPPHFLDPLQASWRVLRQGEQSPAAKQ